MSATLLVVQLRESIVIQLREKGREERALSRCGIFLLLRYSTTIISITPTAAILSPRVIDSALCSPGDQFKVINGKHRDSLSSGVYIYQIPNTGYLYQIHQRHPTLRELERQKNSKKETREKCKRFTLRVVENGQAIFDHFDL